MFKVTLPWPPPGVGANRMWRVSKWGKIYKVPGARKWQEAVAARVGEARERAGWRDEGGWIDVLVKFCPPDRRRRDLHNLIKPLADALAEGLGVDDGRFLFLMELPEVDRAEPRIEVWIDFAGRRAWDWAWRI